MDAVDFLTFDDDGAQSVLATVTAEGGRLRTVAGSAAAVARLRLRDGVLKIGGGLVFPTDGRAFLDALSVAFSGSRLRATEPYAYPPAV